MSEEQEKKAVMATAVESTPSLELEALFRAYSGLVYRAAYRVTGSHEDAEDVLQTVFLRLARHPDREVAPEHAEGYLRRAAVNAALDLVRARAARPASLDQTGDRPSLSPSAAPDRVRASAELRRWLRQALTRLSPAAAEMFVLRYIEERDNPEIARLLGTTPGTVAVTLHRTRERIQQELRKDMGDVV